MAKLKPCPFCGGEAEEKYIRRKTMFAKYKFPYNTHYVYIRCKQCAGTSSVKWTREEAIEAWNRRADNG